MMIRVPRRLLGPPRDDRGFVIPYTTFVDNCGRPDFRIIDHTRVSVCLTQRRCGACGEPMGKHLHFIGGPPCVENGIFYDPPIHKECAEFAIQMCPHLARSKGRYAPTPTAPEGATLAVPPTVVEEKAEWFALMHTTDYTFGMSRDNMVVIRAKMPWLDVTRWRDGALLRETET
jgi:hypothetical protein